MSDVEQAIFDGRRYLDLTASEVLSLTPREFTIEMRAQGERRSDEYERMADAALMARQAYHAKRLKRSDLFKRPVDVGEAEAKSEELVDKAEHATEWMSQFTNFNGVGVGKE